MTLDEINDYEFFTRLYNMFPKDGVIELLDAYQCLQQKPEIAAINSMVIQRDLDEEAKERISRFYEENREKILNLKKKIYSE